MRPSPSQIAPFGVARRAFAPATPLEAWLERVAAAAEPSFDLGAEHVALAWEATSWEPSFDEPARRALFLVVLASLVTQGRGSTRMPLLGPAGRAYLRTILEAVLVGADAGTVEGELDAIAKLAPWLGKPGDRKPFLIDGEFFYHQKLHRSEKLFAGSLAERLAQTPRPAFLENDAGAALARVLESPAHTPAGAVELSPEQQLAVLTALFQPFAVVSGGPGTGKTSIVVSILRVLVRLGIAAEEIALAAPTGKAAQRMGESIAKALGSVRELDGSDRVLVERGPQPQTIHKLLGASRDGSRMKHHEGNRLEQRVVIVYEASMIDMSLMEKLVRAARPEARLVLLGDARQLPSVGAGAVLRDLIPDDASGADVPWRRLVRGKLPAAGQGKHPLARHAVRLTRNYRMNPDDPAGLAILGLARWISPEDGGERPALESVLAVRESVQRLAFERAEAVFDAGPKALRAFLERWYAERIASLADFDGLLDKAYRAGKGTFGEEATVDLRRLFAHFESARVLCLTRVYRTGAVAVNAALRAFHLAHRRGSAKHEFTAGEPVLMLANDYEKGIWNGDQGVALRVSDDGAKPRLSAVFRRGAGFVAFPVELLRGQLEPCFAMTVHKGQGSEFERVAVILPERDVPLLTREILYTATTRSRRSVVILGARELLETAAGRAVERFSGTGDRLG